jgi:hypothetical protein
MAYKPARVFYTHLQNNKTTNWLHGKEVFYMQKGVRFYVDKRSRGKVFVIEAKITGEIYLWDSNYTAHIKPRHPEISIKKIQRTLKDPDVIYKCSKKSPTLYYYKIIQSTEYCVVVSNNKYDKGKTNVVVTAYPDDHRDRFHWEKDYCCYRKSDVQAASYLDYLKENIQILSSADRMGCAGTAI